MGQGALQTNTTGHSNTAIGYQSIYDNTTGSQNTALGDRALEN
jgi:trimeric autotransporter adhesin